MQRRAPMMWSILLAGFMTAGVFAACQSYNFSFQPDTDRHGVHLLFTVQTPSKADILFVIDNSPSMLSKQQSLASSIGVLLDKLAPLDTRYRIGITSTDAHGFLTDCNNAANPPIPSNTMSNPALGAKGNCDDLNVILRRPHDGTLGRLMAAYDANAFAPANFSGLSSAAQAAVQSLVPTSATTGPAGINGVSGVPWVIDREAIDTETCSACACNNCVRGDSCYTDCAQPAAEALVRAYFNSNVSGLGEAGFGWEEGLLSSMWAVGVDPEDPNVDTAIIPTYNLIDASAPNGYVSIDDSGNPNAGSWLRDDALLAVMFLSDEQDCSMPDYLMEARNSYEEPNNPAGSICYQSQAQAAFLDTGYMAKLATTIKGNSASRVAVGFIGGVKKTGPDAAPGRDGMPSDCAISSAPTADAPLDCTCEVDNCDARWCEFTQDSSGFNPPSSCTRTLPGCDGFSGSRYVAFANNFARRTFETICRNDPNAFGSALADFAAIATVACFELQSVTPANGDPNLIQVNRSPGGVGAAEPLPQTSNDSTAEGWYYDPVNNQVCLTGLDRLIGDVYDIFILDTDTVNYGNKRERSLPAQARHHRK